MSTTEHARPEPAGGVSSPGSADSGSTTQRTSAPEEHAGDGLSRREREVLAFERQWWKHAGSKEAAVRELFGLSATRYYQLLNVLIDRPEALRADPLLVKRLRRLRASRAKARVARRLGIYDLDR